VAEACQIRSYLGRSYVLSIDGFGASSGSATWRGKAEAYKINLIKAQAVSQVNMGLALEHKSGLNYMVSALGHKSFLKFMGLAPALQIVSFVEAAAGKRMVAKVAAAAAGWLEGTAAAVQRSRSLVTSLYEKGASVGLLSLQHPTREVALPSCARV
jgi:hypothetical protein